MSKTNKTLMLDFASVYSYIEHWCETRKVGVTHLAWTCKVDKDDPNSNTGALNGIEYKMWIDGRPTNRKALQLLCCADSARDGYPISANQAKCGLIRWLHVKTDCFATQESDIIQFPRTAG